MELRELEKLLRILQSKGVVTYTTPDLSLQLGEIPEKKSRIRNTKTKHPATVDKQPVVVADNKDIEYMSA